MRIWMLILICWDNRLPVRSELHIIQAHFFAQTHQFFKRLMGTLPLFLFVNKHIFAVKLAISVWQQYAILY
jgi:hypothetical protein